MDYIKAYILGKRVKDITGKVKGYNYKGFIYPKR